MRCEGQGRDRPGPRKRIAVVAPVRDSFLVFKRTRDAEKWDEAFQLAAGLLMRIDAKLSLILDELEIDDGEETDYS